MTVTLNVILLISPTRSLLVQLIQVVVRLSKNVPFIGKQLIFIIPSIESKAVRLKSP